MLLKVEEDARMYAQAGLLFDGGDIHAPIWHLRLGQTPLFSNDGEFNLDAVVNFRRNFLFVGDNPQIEMARANPSDSAYRAEANKATRLFSVMHSKNCTDLVKKYPPPETGNPYVYTIDHDGHHYLFTHRWIKHIYSLHLFDTFLSKRLSQPFVSLDVGSSYGAFQYLMRKHGVGCHQVLVDFPEQLLLARYFLQQNFPDARIAGISELSGMQTIDRQFFTQYDFVLLPWQWYERLAADSVDLFSSFACLGELNRDLFNYYTLHPAFRTSSYYFLVNPVAPTENSKHSGNTDISLLDYEMISREKALHFSYSPVNFMTYSVESRRLPPFFEYIGSR